MMFILDDTEITITPFSKVCLPCKHLIDYGEGRKCKAFKNIPLEIWEGKNNHKKPYRGDNGIVFTPSS